MSNSIDDQNTDAAGAGFEPTAVKLSDLKLNRPRYVNVKGTHVVVALIDAQDTAAPPDLVAFSALCPHQMGDLSGGMLGQGGIDCPLHFYRFDVRSGACLWPRDGGMSLKTYPVQVNADIVSIKVEAPSWT